MLSNSAPSLQRFGIFTHSRTEYKKVDRDENGYSDQMKEGFIKQRKVKNRPSYEDLLKDVNSMPMTSVGKKYGVSDTAVRKWIKFYEKIGK